MNEPKRYSPQMIRSAGLTTITAHSACEGTQPNSREHILAAIASGEKLWYTAFQLGGKDVLS